jgi:predicted permease
MILGMSIFVVLNQIAPLFIIMSIGILLGKLKILGSSFSKNMSQVCILVLVPAATIKSFYAKISPEMIREGLSLIVAGAIAVAATFALAALVIRLLKIKIPSSNVIYFTLMFSNFGYVGMGILTAVYGDKGLFYMTMFALVIRFAFNSLGTMIMQRGEENAGAISLRKALLNPPIIGLLAAILVMVFQIQFPPIIETTLFSLAASLSPMGMLTLGVITASFSLKEFFDDTRVYLIVALRLIIIPLTATTIMTAAALTLALPAAANSSLLAEKYGGDVKLGTQIVTISNIFSVLTMPVIVAFAEKLAY